MTYSNRTPKDRAALDAATVKKLGKRGLARGDVHAKFTEDGAPTLRMVSDSLRRLVRDGKATRNGPVKAPLYARAEV